MTTSSNPPRSGHREPGSFRDPNGFVFRKDGVIYRQVNASYADYYDLLMDSGLYQRLTDKGRLIPHVEENMTLAHGDNAYKIIRPEPVTFISYPYEWSFSQLRDAALLTLRIQREALKKGMILKDASAYNVQFIDGKPVFIDTLSFERYEEGQIWVAYRQFCQHFLAPLVLAHYKDIRFIGLSRLYIDGIPLDLAASLLPRRSWLKMGVALHIHMHSRAQKRYADSASTAQTQARKLSRKSLDNIVNSLFDTVKGLKWRANTTAWAQYYQGDSYDQAGLDYKQALVRQYIEQAGPQTVWDLGANTGVFSRIASTLGINTIAWDIDPGAVELNYRQLKQDRDQNLLPLILDLTNPSPAIGWANGERLSFIERGNADLILALALIHHLAIGNNLPLADIAQFLSRLSEWLVIEFVPKEDPKVQTLLATREDIFPEYNQSDFEAVFSGHFKIVQSEQVKNSHRVVYLMQRQSDNTS